MSTTKPASLIQRETTGKLLDQWAQRHPQPRRKASATPRRIQQFLNEFQARSKQASEELKRSPTVTLPEKGIWLTGRPTPRGTPLYWPVATVSAATTDDQFTAEIRLALISEADGIVTAQGWRFDMPESPPPTTATESPAVPATVPRPMGHVQPIRSWHRFSTSACLLHPHGKADLPCGSRSAFTDHPGRGYALPLVNESHPAFPLRATTLPGLTVTMLVSLYGTPLAEEIVEQSRIRASCGKDLAREINEILCLR